MTIGTHDSILKSIEEVENIINGFPDHNKCTVENSDMDFWKEVKSQMTEIAKLTYQTDQFQCQCWMYDCPFKSKNLSQVYSAPMLSRRMSEPVDPSCRKHISYGGFEPMLNESNFETEFEIEEETTFSLGSTPFQRRRAQVKRNKRNSGNFSDVSPSQQQIVKKRPQTLPRKNN